VQTSVVGGKIKVFELFEGEPKRTDDEEGILPSQKPVMLAKLEATLTMSQ